MSSSDPSKALLMHHFLKDLTMMLSGMAFHAADNHRATSEGAARKGRLKERCGLETRNNFFFFRLRNRQKLVRIRFGCGLDSRIYGIFLWGGVVSPIPNPQQGGPIYPFLFGSSPLTCLAWEALTAATLPLSGSFDHAISTIKSSDTFGEDDYSLCSKLSAKLPNRK